MSDIIFAIDEAEGLRTRARFLRHMDELRVLGKLQKPMRSAVGHWVDPDGVSWLEPAYAIDEADFDAFVRPHGWVNGQQCVLRLTVGRAEIVGLARHAGKVSPIGVFTCAGKGMPAGDWTRFDDTGDYWVVVDD